MCRQNVELLPCTCHVHKCLEDTEYIMILNWNEPHNSNETYRLHSEFA